MENRIQHHQCFVNVCTVHRQGKVYSVKCTLFGTDWNAFMLIYYKPTYKITSQIHVYKFNGCFRIGTIILNFDLCMWMQWKSIKLVDRSEAIMSTNLSNYLHFYSEQFFLCLWCLAWSYFMHWEEPPNQIQWHFSNIGLLCFS